MHYTDPKPDADVEILLRALHRADQNWPDRQDIERYWEEQQSFRPFASVEEAEIAIEKFHDHESVEARISQIGWRLRERAIDVFLDAHAPTSDSHQRSSARYINQMMSTSGYNRLELFLTDISEHGVEEAVKRFRTVDRGSKYGHIFCGLLALIEIGLLLLILNACQHGFQTMVICALGFIYSAIAFQGLSSNDFNVRRFATVIGEIYRIRYLLKDRAFKRDEAEQEFLELDKILAKSQVRYWIATAKFCIIDLICLVGLAMNAL